MVDLCRSPVLVGESRVGLSEHASGHGPGVGQHHAGREAQRGDGGLQRVVRGLLAVEALHDRGR